MSEPAEGWWQGGGSVAHPCLRWPTPLHVTFVLHCRPMPVPFAEAVAAAVQGGWLLKEADAVRVVPTAPSREQLLLAMQALDITLQYYDLVCVDRTLVPVEQFYAALAGVGGPDLVCSFPVQSSSTAGWLAAGNLSAVLLLLVVTAGDAGNHCWGCR